MAAGGKEMEIAIKIAGKVESSFKNALSQVTKGLGSITKTVASATAAAASAVGAIAVSAVDVGKEFETSMSQVQATMLLDTGTAEGAAAMATLEEAARECGRTTAFSATEAAEALNNLAMAGYDATDAATALPTVLNLAGAGGLELADSARYITASLAALGIDKTEENFNHFADTLAITASKAKTDVSQLGDAITTLGGTGKGLKGGTEEIAAALGILADADITGSEGGTHLRNMILSLQNPRNADAAKAFKQLGIEAYDSTGKMRGLNEIFGDINASMEGMTDQQKNDIMSTIFKETDLAAANALLADCGARFDELYEAAYNSSEGIGAAAKMYSIQMDNLEGDIDILKSGLADLGISIYKDLNGPLRDMTQLATSMVGELSDAYKSGGMEGMVGAVGGCLAEVVNTIADYAPKVISMGVDLLENFISGITENSGALAASAAEIITVFVEGLFTLVPQVILAGIDILTQFAQSMTAQLPQLINTGMQAIGNLINGIIQRLPEIIQIGIQLILSLVQGIISNLPQLLQMGGQIILNLVSGITLMLPMIIQGGIQLITSLIQGIIANLGNIVQVAVEIVLALVTGLISAIPQLTAAVPQLVGALIETILSTNWLDVGIQIIKGLINGILSTGKSLWNTIKSLLTGDIDIPDISSQSAAVVNSYASGINSNAGAVTAAVGGMTTTAFSSMDTSGATAAGAQAGTAFSTGLTDSMASGGLDTAAFSANMSNMGTEGAAALNTSLSAGLATPVDTSGLLDAGAINTSMTTAGTEGATAFTTGLNTGLSAATISTSGLAVDTSGLTTTMTTAGTEGATAIGTGMTGNSQAVTQAASTLGNDVNTALDDGWNRANTSAQTAMQQLATTVTSAANSAAGAVKAAFENMTITIPKPRIPVISVSTSSVSYGDGGSVSVPNFSVSWNALGGIFDQPTIFNTPAGMQGVGEAGPEAVLPLDTLWAKMKEILNEAIAANSGASLIDAFIDKLKGIGNGGGGRQPELAGAGGPTIQYSPVYNLYGSAGKEEIAEADRRSQAEFNKQMKQYLKDQQRRKL